MGITSKDYFRSYGCEFSISKITGVKISIASKSMRTDPTKYYIIGTIYTGEEKTFDNFLETLDSFDLSITCKLNSGVLGNCEIKGIEIISGKGKHDRGYTFVAKDWIELK